MQQLQTHAVPPVSLRLSIKCVEMTHSISLQQGSHAGVHRSPRVTSLFSAVPLINPLLHPEGKEKKKQKHNQERPLMDNAGCSPSDEEPLSKERGYRKKKKKLVLRTTADRGHRKGTNQISGETRYIFQDWSIQALML